MTKKLQIKQIMAIALSIIMIIGVMPMTAFANGTYTFPSLSQSGDNNSTLRYYLTDENAGDVEITQYSGYVALALVLDNGWYFDRWDTYFNGFEDIPILSDPEVKGNNPVGAEGYYTFFNVDQHSPFENHSGYRNVTIRIQKSTGFYGDHSVTAVLKPIVTVNAGEGVSYQVATNYPSYTNLAANQVAVKYGDNATVTYSVDNKYVVTNVSANYGTNYSDNGTAVTVNSIIKPVTVTINTKLKQHNVIFDANGGSGTMSAQVFEHSVAQTLTANSFTKVGHTFAGWNTKADGTGTAYTDKQSVTFTPVNDGDSITLYTQWTECNNHTWTDGECTACGTACSHSGGTATCIEKAVCSACGQYYGETLGHDWGNWISNNDGTHTRTCSNDASHTETNDCSGGTATCTEKAKCSVCATAYGEFVAHTYSNDWKSDGTNHWHECSCGAKTDEAAHSGGTATCTEKAKCTDCGTSYGELADHTYDNATCEAPATCSECRATTGDALGHKDENTDHTCDRGCGKTDMGIHAAASGKHTCDYCGNAVTTCTDFADVVKPEALKSAADCTNPAVYFKSCTVCGANGTETFTSGDAKGHTYENGKCTVCEAVDPNYVPETSSPQTGDNSNMALWIALLFISGGALLALTVYNRKRRTYLR